MILIREQVINFTDFVYTAGGEFLSASRRNWDHWSVSASFALLHVPPPFRLSQTENPILHSSISGPTMANTRVCWRSRVAVRFRPQKLCDWMGVGAHSVLVSWGWYYGDSKRALGRATAGTVGAARNPFLACTGACGRPRCKLQPQGDHWGVMHPPPPPPRPKKKKLRLFDNPVKVTANIRYNLLASGSLLRWSLRRWTDSVTRPFFYVSVCLGKHSVCLFESFSTAGSLRCPSLALCIPVHHLRPPRSVCQEFPHVGSMANTEILIVLSLLAASQAYIPLHEIL